MSDCYNLLWLFPASTVGFRTYLIMHWYVHHVVQCMYKQPEVDQAWGQIQIQIL